MHQPNPNSPHGMVSYGTPLDANTIEAFELTPVQTYEQIADNIIKGMKLSPKYARKYLELIYTDKFEVSAIVTMHYEHSCGLPGNEVFKPSKLIFLIIECLIKIVQETEVD
jgi:hypothetical protein